MGQSDTESKKHTASKRKLRKLRADGLVGGSGRMSAFFSIALGLTIMFFSVVEIYTTMTDAITASVGVIGLPFGEAQESIMKSLMPILFGSILPLVGAIVIIAVMSTIIFNGGILFSLKPVMPEINRVSPITGFKRIYGIRLAAEFPVITIRFLSWITFAALVGIWPLVQFLSVWSCEASCVLGYAGSKFSLLILGAVFLFLAFASVEIMLQRWFFLSEQKMTDSEKKQERKDQNGAPEIKKEQKKQRKKLLEPRREVGPERASMCVYDSENSVGIEFDLSAFQGVCLVAKAKGEDEAFELRMQIYRHKRPEVEFPPLVNALMSAELGEMIDPELIPLVAQAVKMHNERA
ncbi:MAG: EscU/YscU/HrcU family type III secretion system export apparatus switch protein [Pseudomonadota bacterium]